MEQNIHQDDVEAVCYDKSENKDVTLKSIRVAILAN